MAAPAPGNELKLCEKCFAMLPEGAEFCPDCGAPTVTAPGAGGSDSAIYPELARANLLRMRGEYKQAEDVCLSILRRFPNNATANTLLGDISAEQGNLHEAAQWYELALDILPDSELDQQKLTAVKQRMAEREAATTAKALELPQRRGLGPLAVALLVCAIAVVGAISFVIGRQGKIGATLFDKPLVLRPDKQTEPPKEPTRTEPPPAAEEKTKPEEAAATPNWPGRSQEDAELTTSLAKGLGDGPQVLDASMDPRTKGVRVTFLANEGTDERLLAARLCAGVLAQRADTSVVVARGLRANRLYYVVTATREKYAPTADSAWQEAHKGDDKALADAILSDEWRASASP